MPRDLEWWAAELRRIVEEQRARREADEVKERVTRLERELDELGKRWRQHVPEVERSQS